MPYSMRPRKSGPSYADDEAYEADLGPSRKKSKGSRKHAAPSGSPRKVARRRPGKLKNLPEMPLDILFEIFSLLRPLDLLHLAWTTKALRAVIMRRSAAWVWRVSLAAVDGLPPCPEDLTEVQWAHLAFYAHCHFCDKANLKTVFWACRLRACTKCLTDQDYFRLDDRYSKIACGRWTRRFVDYIQIGPIVEDPRSRQHPHKVFIPQATWKFLSVEAVTRCESGEAMQPFIAEKKEMMARLSEHVKLCEVYLNTVNDARIKEVEDRREQRYESIVSRLRDLGWGHELDRLAERGFQCGEPDKTWLANHPLVKKSQVLTEKVWKTIQPPLEELMQYIKSRHLFKYHRILMYSREAVLKNLLESFIASRPPLEAVPSLADFASMSVFQSILESPVDVEVTEASFLQPVSHLPELAEEWRQSTMQFLLGLVRHGSETSQLSLATTVFKCAHCSTLISFPRILVHPCMFSSYTSRTAKGERHCFWQGGGPWNYGGKGVTFEEAASEASRQFVIMSGGNAQKVTAAEMDSKDSRFECLRCDNISPIFGLMTWRQAIQHVDWYHRTIVIPKDWKCLDEKEMNIARELQRKTVKGLLTPPCTMKLYCLHCRQKEVEYSQLEEHLHEIHGIDGSNLIDSAGKDWCTDLDVPPFGPRNFHESPDE